MSPNHARDQFTLLRRLALAAFALAALLLGTAPSRAADVTLAWDAVTGATVAGYTVHWGTAPGVYVSQQDAGSATTRTISGLADGTTYHFAVTSHDGAGGRSAYSNEVSTTTGYAAPSSNFTVSATSGPAPLAVNFTSTSTGVIASYAWTFGDGTSSTSANPVKTYASAGVYTVALTVSGPGGSDTRTNNGYITVTTPADSTPPTAPASLTATTGGSGMIDLSWTAATDNVGVTGYRVERCLGATCTNFAQIATPAGTTYASTGLVAGTTYRYRVRAADAAGNLGPFSPIASATTAAAPDTTAPTAPGTLTAAVNGSAAVSLSWTAAADNVAVTGYRVERCQGSSCTSFAQIGTPTGTTFGDAGLVAGTTYRYRVRATDAAGNLGPYSPIASATTAVAAPSASFTATPVSGISPLAVTFTSTSTGSITSYAWSFGDGTTSIVQNPSKTYSSPGTFTVGLTVTGPGGSNTSTMTNLIAVGAVPATLESVGMLVDHANPPGTTSNGNGILEPGETVLIAPVWEMVAGGAVTVSANARVSGQGSSAFTLEDSAASYGTLSPGAVVDCQSATGNCYRLAVANVVRRPTLKWGVSFTETLSTGKVVTRTVPIGRSFADVATSDMFYPMIEALVWNDVTVGYTDGTFQPVAEVTRWQTAMFLARGKARVAGLAEIPASGSVGTSPYNCVSGGTSVFADVPPGDAGCRQLHFLAAGKVDVSYGCGASDLACPAIATTRAAMAVLVAGSASEAGDAGVPLAGTFSDTGTARSYNCGVTGGSRFTDVPSSAAFCRHVNYLWARGIVDGYADGTFQPQLGLTRGQMAKFVASAFRLRVE